MQKSNITEEITQETFVKALDNFDSFKGTCKVNTWLCQIAKNHYFNILDKNKKIDYDSRIQKSVAEDFANLLIGSILFGCELSRFIMNSSKGN